MRLEDKVGHLAYLALFGGTQLIAFELWMGWPSRAVGDLLWLLLGFRLNLQSVKVWSAFFLLVDVYGWWRWTG